MKLIITKFSLFLVLVAFFATVFILVRKSDFVDNSALVYRQTRLLESELLKLKKIWQSPNLELRKQCRKTLSLAHDVPSEFFNCNPLLIECLATLKVSPLQLSFHKFSDHSFYKRVHNGSEDLLVDNGVKLIVSLPENSQLEVTAYLDNTCQETYLPQRTYSYADIYSKDYLWDNENRHIFIDKFLVNNFQVYEWALLTEAKDLALTLAEKKEWHFVNTTLNRAQQESFCNYWGKQLLSAHVLDAGSFIPGSEASQFHTHVFKSRYHWTRKDRETFLYKANRKQTVEIKAEDCYHAYTADCQKFYSLENAKAESSSWIGIYQVLGGHLESLNNPFDSFLNLKASSQYFSAAADWHQLGKRAHWEGEANDPKSFSWKTDRDAEKELLPHSQEFYPIAFRCMREK